MSSYFLVLSTIAQQDIEAAADYYNTISPNLKRAFINSLEESLNLITQTPFLFSERFEDVRIKLVKKFPYTIFYKIDSTIVKVHGVLHQKRNPDLLTSRLKK